MSGGAAGPRPVHLARGCVLALGLVLLGAPRASAQGVRGWATTSARFFELRPLTLDTAQAAEVEVGADGVARVDGRPVSCSVDVPCVFTRPLAERNAWVGSQDVGFTAWGLGVQGLSVTGLVRARNRLTGELDWPLSEDPFDVLVGYAELRRGRFRARLGRQETPSGLGFSGFDGGALRVDAEGAWVEAYGGRSLARGLSETRREALRGIEDFVPDQDAYLWGGAVGLRLGRTDLAARYQREIIADRSGLVGERAAFDAASVLPGAIRLRGSLDYDVPFDRVGKAQLTLQRAWLEGRVLTELEARRYVPYFELSTVWGFFSPVPYHEGRVRVSAGVSRASGVQVSLAAREYGAPSTTTIFRPLEDRGWQGDVALFWSPSEELRWDVSYQIDWGNSAFLQALDASALWRLAPAVSLRFNGTTFQQFEAYRLGDGRAIGGGMGVVWELKEGVRLDGSFLVLRQDAGRGAPDDIWNQTRGSIGLRYAFGSDPGLAGRRP